MKLNFKDGKANKIHIYVDGEYSMTVDRDFVASLPYHENSQIDETQLAQLEKAVSCRRAFNKAADLLSRRDHSRKELIMKLRQKGYADGAEEACDKLEEYGYIDDSRFAKVYASELVRLKGFGKRRIVQELYKKGIDREIIDEVTEELEFCSDDLCDILERKYGRYLDTEKGVNRAVNGLARMGYSYGEIKQALEELKSRADEYDYLKEDNENE